MMCYRDMTFCSSPACRNACGRQLTREDREDARRWWGSDDPPIAKAPFCDDAGELSRRERRSATRETGAQDDA